MCIAQVSNRPNSTWPFALKMQSALVDLQHRSNFIAKHVLKIQFVSSDMKTVNQEMVAACRSRETNAKIGLS